MGVGETSFNSRFTHLAGARPMLKIKRINQNEILHKPRQHCCRGMCKISLWLNQQIEFDCSIIWKYSIPNAWWNVAPMAINHQRLNWHTYSICRRAHLCLVCSCVNSQPHSVRSECLKSRTTESLDGIRYFAYEYNINEHADSRHRAPITWLHYRCLSWLPECPKRAGDVLVRVCV